MCVHILREILSCVRVESSRPYFFLSLILKLVFQFQSIKCMIRESESEVARLCPTLCDPMDCSLSASSIHWIFQARVLEWIAIYFSRGSSQPRYQTQVSRIAGRRFTFWATREAQ